ncbi:hypothetical protein [Cryobacterium zongtaii]|nr:hypothetical protein [Cryobacterium zongtaii]
MSTSASVIFCAFSSAADPRLQGWLSFREHLQSGEVGLARIVPVPRRGGARGTSATDGSWSAHSGIWRLLASNSRELGRSSSVYSSFATARAHVLALQLGVDRMAMRAVTGPVSGTHGWVVTVDNVAVMTSGRWYGTTSASRDACAGALAALRSAVVTADPRRMVEPGARRSRRPRGDAELAGVW